MDVHMLHRPDARYLKMRMVLLVSVNEFICSQVFLAQAILLIYFLKKLFNSTDKIVYQRKYVIVFNCTIIVVFLYAYKLFFHCTAGIVYCTEIIVFNCTVTIVLYRTDAAVLTVALHFCLTDTIVHHCTDTIVFYCTYIYIYINTLLP